MGPAHPSSDSSVCPALTSEVTLRGNFKRKFGVAVPRESASANSCRRLKPLLPVIPIPIFTAGAYIRSSGWMPSSSSPVLSVISVRWQSNRRRARMLGSSTATFSAL